MKTTSVLIMMKSMIRVNIFSFVAIPFLVLFFACANVDNVDSKHFLYETELTVEYIFPLGESIYPRVMHIYNDYLILLQLNNPGYSFDYFFQAYQLSDGAYKGSFGAKGRGPGEWLNVDIIHSPVNSPYLYLCDASSRQSKVEILKTVIDSVVRLQIIDTFQIDKGFLVMNRPVIRNDSLLVFDEITFEQRALRVHHLDKTYPVITWEYGTKVSDPYFDENMGILRANASCIMFIYNFKDRIDIMDWNLKLKRSLNYQKVKPVFHKEWADRVKYHTPSYLGDNFLYTFYTGMSSNELKAKKSQGFALEVFDLEGTPIYRYFFTEPIPDLFAVDERTFTLYGYRESGGMEDSISVYHLSGLREYLQNK